jgi:hypothetical protein
MGWYEDSATKYNDAMKEKERWRVNLDGSLTPLNANASYTAWAFKIKKASEKIGPW